VTVPKSHQGLCEAVHHMYRGKLVKAGDLPKYLGAQTGLESFHVMFSKSLVSYSKTLSRVANRVENCDVHSALCVPLCEFSQWSFPPCSRFLHDFSGCGLAIRKSVWIRLTSKQLFSLAPKCLLACLTFKIP
jgi:hypothetical protein